MPFSIFSSIGLNSRGLRWADYVARIEEGRSGFSTNSMYHAKKRKKKKRQCKIPDVS